MEKVKAVYPQDNYILHIKFDNGQLRKFDVSPYLSKGDFIKLKDVNIFRSAYVDYDTVCWPGNLDIAPDTLFDRSVVIPD